MCDDGGLAYSSLVYYEWERLTKAPKHTQSVGWRIKTEVKQKDQARIARVRVKKVKTSARFSHF